MLENINTIHYILGVFAALGIFSALSMGHIFEDMLEKRGKEVSIIFRLIIKMIISIIGGIIAAILIAL